MADNYLEKRAEELRETRPKVVRNHPSLESLLKRNRSYRGYDAALPEEHLPHPGEEPSAYIVVCSAASGRVVDIDLGIAAQSILLRAVEMGLGGIFILNFKADELAAALSLPLPPLAVIGIGKPVERIFLKPVQEGASLAYYRKDGAHIVPKLQLDNLLL